MSWADVRAALLAASREGADDAASCYVLYESMEALERMYGLSRDHFFLQALGYVARRVYEAGLYAYAGRTLAEQALDPFDILGQVSESDLWRALQVLRGFGNRSVHVKLPGLTRGERAALVLAVFHVCRFAVSRRESLKELAYEVLRPRAAGEEKPWDPKEKQRNPKEKPKETRGKPKEKPKDDRMKTM